MCGIFGYAGRQNAVQMVLSGLEKLEYRGYDSAGIVGIRQGQLHFAKQAGKLEKLEQEVLNSRLELDSAIGHTRWATHGKPSFENAHPHFDSGMSVAVVHNGIIENDQEFRRMLKNKGVAFKSDTDTEVIPHLIAHYYKGDFLDAVCTVVSQLRGAFALAIIHRDHPDCLIAVAKECPLAIGIGADESFISSDSHAFAAYTRDVLFLSASEIALVRPGAYEVYDTSRTLLKKPLHRIEIRPDDGVKGNFEHYTLKEIFEQPRVLETALLGRLVEEYGTVKFDELTFDINDFLGIERILILGCGTSWHAGYLAEYMLEDIARIPVQVEISSEYRYKNPIVLHNTLVIAISQSGETADTLAATRELQAKGAKVLALCNVLGSTLEREADACIYLRAGTEIGVCSTKAFTNQVMTLYLLTIMIARMRFLDKKVGQEYLYPVKQLSLCIQEILDRAEEIHAVAKRYARFENFFFVGRRYMYPTCLEGALKLKEISYINANGYPAGELKHGPIALITEECPTVAFCSNKQTYGKLLNNLREIKARGGPVIAIAEEGGDGELSQIADDIICVPETRDELASIPASVAAQLFAYYVALERGAEIDKPRNLAKSVTVE
jgi:glutamine---fructose-6-phosphate transaminase (isomerizing)